MKRQAAIERRRRRSEAVLERWALSCAECWRAATASELVFRPDLSVMTRLAYSLGGPRPYCGARTRVLAQVGERRTALSVSLGELSGQAGDRHRKRFRRPDRRSNRLLIHSPGNLHSLDQAA